MNGSGWIGMEFLVAAAVLVVHLAVSTTLAAVTALNPVALRRIAREAPGRLRDVESLDQDSASARLSLILVQQVGLLVVAALVGDGLRRAAVAYPWAWAILGTTFVGAIVLQGLVARWLAIRNPRSTLRWSAGVAFAVSLPLRPIAALLARVLAAVPADSVATEEEREEREDVEVEALIEVGEREGLLEEEEGKMMRGIVDLDETVVRELMTPRTKIVALPSDSTVAEARRTVIRAGHSRLPVYRENLDHVVGILHARDLFRAWEDGDDSRTIDGLVRQASFVPETASAAVLLSGMRQKRPIAMVLDEYGGVSGLVTLEDLLEEIVGEIHDEHETADELIASEDGWSIPASTHIEEIEELLHVDVGPRDFDTVGGLVVEGFGRVPAVGERMVTRGLDVRVLSADERRVHRVRLRVAESGEESTSRVG